MPKVFSATAEFFGSAVTELGWSWGMWKPSDLLRVPKFLREGDICQGWRTLSSAQRRSQVEPQLGPTSPPAPQGALSPPAPGWLRPAMPREAPSLGPSPLAASAARGHPAVPGPITAPGLPLAAPALPARCSRRPCPSQGSWRRAEGRQVGKKALMDNFFLFSTKTS